MLFVIHVRKGITTLPDGVLALELALIPLALALFSLVLRAPRSLDALELTMRLCWQPDVNLIPGPY
jgi:hypothetical protein